MTQLGAFKDQSIAQARLLYDSDESVLSRYRSLLKDSHDHLADTTGSTPEAREALELEVARFFSDAQIVGGQAAKLFQILVRHLRKPATDDEMDAWAIEARAQLRTTYGDDAGAKMAQVNAFIGAHPKVKDMLNKSGVGSNPDWVMALAEQEPAIRLQRGGLEASGSQNGEWIPFGPRK